MSDVTALWNNAELAQASYANLRAGENTDAIVVAPAGAKGAGMSVEQALEFTARYPTVVRQYDDSDSGTSFSATIFKNTNGDAAGNLVLAIRGPLELTGTPNDLTTDLDIFNSVARATIKSWRRRTCGGRCLPLKRRFVSARATRCLEITASHILASDPRERPNEYL